MRCRNDPLQQVMVERQCNLSRAQRLQVVRVAQFERARRTAGCKQVHARDGRAGARRVGVEVLLA